MQIIIKIENIDIALPINYNHILQGVIYRALSDSPEYAVTQHDYGLKREKRTFKTFTFSPLLGKYKVKNKKITFLGSVTWEIRSVEEEFIKTIGEHYNNYGIELLGQKIDGLNISVDDKHIKSESIDITMKSPICIYSMDPETRRTYFYTPEQRGFYELIRQNAIKRYSAYYNEEYSECLDFTPKYVRRSDKTITRYKDMMLDCWGGEYTLVGTPKMLDFLFQSGLGTRNAQGFGMFDYE